MQLLFDVKTLIERIRCGDVKVRGQVFGVAEAGVLKAWCLFGVPLVVRQYNPNFKVKWHLGHWPLLSLKRWPSFRTVKRETHDRPACLYLSVGSLPFRDNGSGIPRVAKNLCCEGLKQTDVKVVPVYPDPATGVYRRADNWCIQQGLPASNVPAVDAEITAAPGDWLVQTMINANALEFDATYLESFREAGGRLGVVLHDIIAEEHPEFFKARDGRNFSRWLRRIASFDGIFAVSQASEDAFKAWRDRTGSVASAQTGYFHLGADFKPRSQTAGVTTLPAELTQRPVFLQVSTLEPRKGYAQLVSAFEKLWSEGVDVNLVIVGRRGWMVNDLVRRLKRHPELNHRLFWFAHATDDELAALYDTAAGVIVASEAEGFGLSVVEGLWHQRPVIARDIPVFREVGGESLHYFSGKAPEALAEAVRGVLRETGKPVSQTVVPLSWSESFGAFARLVHQFSSPSDKGQSL